MSNRSKCRNMSENLISIKCWYFIAKVWINQNVGIWLKNKELIRILKLRTKLGINQNDQIWVLTTKLFKMLYFKWKVGNQSKSWCLSAIRWELIKMLKFECKMSNRSKCWNLSKKDRSIKCWYSIARVEIDQIIGIWLKNKELIKILKFEDNIKNQSKCWNLSAKCQVDQNAEIWVKKEDWSKCQNLSERGGINKNIEIWRQSWESIKMLKFER